MELKEPEVAASSSAAADSSDGDATMLVPGLSRRANKRKGKRKGKSDGASRTAKRAKSDPQQSPLAAACDSTATASLAVDEVTSVIS